MATLAATPLAPSPSRFTDGPNDAPGDALPQGAESDGCSVLSLAYGTSLHHAELAGSDRPHPRDTENPRQGGVCSVGARLLAAWHSHPARDFTETTTSRRHGSFPRPRPVTCFLVYDAEGSVASLTARPYIVPAAEGSVALLTARPSCGVARAEGSVAQPYTHRQKQNPKASSLYKRSAAAVNSFGPRVSEERFHAHEGVVRHKPQNHPSRLAHDLISAKTTSYPLRRANPLSFTHWRKAPKTTKEG